ncbi:hypothetical protein V8E36_009880 [Tilletia maclaganii]
MAFPLSVEQGWAEYLLGPPCDPMALPSASQNCLNMLDPSIQRAYRLAYQSSKAAHEGGKTPNWTSLWAYECFSALPDGHAERMKAHFDQYFQTVECFVAARTQSGGGQQVAGARVRNGNEESAEGNSIVEPADEAAADDGNSFGYGQDDDDSDGASSRRSIPFGRKRVRDGSTSDDGASAATRSHRRVSSPSASSEAKRPKVAAGLDGPGKPRSVPTLSNAARESLRGFDTGIHQVWLYCGLHRWRAGGLVEEVPLTFDQAGAEASANGPADQWSSIRERWECRFCRAQHHEQVGQTSNLAKHLKKCPRAPH